MDPETLRSLLPWRHPFVMIDRVVECVPHERILAVKAVLGDDMMALAHQPGTAVFPGLMLIEGMSQCAAVLFQRSYGAIPPSRLPLLGHIKARFYGSAAAGQEVSYSVRAVKMTSTSGYFQGEARVAAVAIAEAELAFAVAGLEPGGEPPGDDDPARRGGLPSSRGPSR